MTVFLVFLALFRFGEIGERIAQLYTEACCNIHVYVFAYLKIHNVYLACKRFEKNID